MGLTHPPSQPLPPLHPRFIPLQSHPRLEILRARPARIQFREKSEELAHFGLLSWRGCLGVGGAEGVEESPGGAAESFDVGGAIGGLGGEGGCGCGGG